MDLHFNAQKVSTLDVLPETTIGELKDVLKNWLFSQNIYKYSIVVQLNDGEFINPIVFSSNQYDNVCFSTQGHLLNGGRINVTTPSFVNSPSESSKKDKPNEQSIQHGDFTQLPPDVIREIAMDLDIRSLLNFCQTEKRINNLVCKNQFFWTPKIYRDLGVSIEGSNATIKDYRKYDLNSDLVKDVLRDVHPSLSITNDAVNMVLYILRPVFDQIKHSSNMEETLKQLMKDTLIKISYGCYQKDSMRYGRRKPQNVIEYLIAELVELGGIRALDYGKKRITTLDIYLPIYTDDDLYYTLYKYMIPFPGSDLIQEYGMWLPLNYIKAIPYTLSRDFKDGLVMIFRCVIDSYHGETSEYVTKLADQIALKAGRLPVSRDKESAFKKYVKYPIKLLQHEIAQSIAKYASEIQPTKPLTFRTLLYSSLANPYLSDIPGLDMVQMFKRRMPSP